MTLYRFYYECYFGINMFFFSEKRYKCTGCSRTYLRKESLHYHKLHKCGIDPHLACPSLGCTYKAKIKVCLQSHLFHRHGIPFETSKLMLRNHRHSYNTTTTYNKIM